MRKLMTVAAALCVAAAALAAAPVHAYMEDKGVRVDRLKNDDGDAPTPDYGPRSRTPRPKRLMRTRRLSRN